MLRATVQSRVGPTEQRLNQFAPVIRATARRLAIGLPPSLDVDDLMSVGAIGLMDAMEKYDPTRDATFTAYAVHRIRGAMLDEIRSMNWTPRSVHQKFSLLQKTRTALVARLGRLPLNEEVGAALKMSVGVLHSFLMEARGAVMISLDDVNLHEPAEHNVVELLVDKHQSDPLSSLVQEREWEVVYQLMSMLPPKERLVVKLYYIQDLTMRAIGERLSMTESRVSQLHSKAILRLKRMALFAAGSRPC